MAPGSAIRTTADELIDTTSAHIVCTVGEADTGVNLVASGAGIAGTTELPTRACRSQVNHHENN
jgi:hypothetical protein